MTDTHTPGPWVIEPNPTIPEGQQIASYEATGDMAGNRCLQIIVRTHNPKDFNLIISALEMLTILKEAAQPMGLSEHDFKRWLPRAQAIIAKAEGRGPLTNG